MLRLPSVPVSLEQRRDSKLGIPSLSVIGAVGFMFPFLVGMGLMPNSTQGQPQEDPVVVEKAEAGDSGFWRLRSKHLLYGMPQQTDNRHNVQAPEESEILPGISVLVREGFVVGLLGHSVKKVSYCI